MFKNFQTIQQILAKLYHSNGHAQHGWFENVSSIFVAKDLEQRKKQCVPDET